MFRGVDVEAGAGVAVTVAGEPVEASVTYNEATLSLTVRIASLDRAAGAVVVFPDGLAVAADPAIDDAFAVLKDAQMLYLTKEKAYGLIKDLGKDALPALATLEDLHGVDESRFHDSHMPQPVIQALAEVLTRA